VSTLSLEPFPRIAYSECPFLDTPGRPSRGARPEHCGANIYLRCGTLTSCNGLRLLEVAEPSGNSASRLSGSKPSHGRVMVEATGRERKRKERKRKEQNGKERVESHDIAVYKERKVEEEEEQQSFV
jgi:hypothetical protein